MMRIQKINLWKTVLSVCITSCMLYQCTSYTSSISEYKIVDAPIKNAGIDVLAFSPDGTKLLAGCRDNTAKLIELLNSPGSIINTYSHKGAVHAVAFSPDGFNVYCGSVDGAIIMYAADTNEIVESVQYNAQTGDKTNSIYPFKKDGNFILVSGMEPTAQIINLKEKKVIQQFHVPGQVFTEAVFSPDESQVLTASTDGNVRIYNTNTGKLLQTVNTIDDSNPPQHRTVEWIGLSLSGTQFITAGIDQSVKIFDAKSFQLLHTLNGHDRGVKYAAFLPNGKQVVSAGLDQKVILWDAAGQKKLDSHQLHQRPILSGALSPDSKFLATGDIEGNLVIWELPNVN